MKARIKWIEDRTFIGESGSGHTVVMSASPKRSDRVLGPSPMELVLIGMGGCAAFDVVHILDKGREPIAGCVAELEAERAGDDPRAVQD